MTITNEKEKEKVGQLDNGYVTKNEEELVVICHQMIEMFRASRMKPSQSLTVLWSGLRAMYVAWVAFGGPQDRALAHLRQEYEDVKRTIVTEPPGTQVRNDN